MDIDVQIFYSIVNHSVSNVVHNIIDSTEFKLPMCRYNLMSCSSSMPLETHSSWCRIFFLFFICGGHVDTFNFCFTRKVQFYYEKLLKICQNDYMLTTSCCTEAVAPLCFARLGLGVLCKWEMWHDLIAPLYLTWLTLASLSCADMWRDWARTSWVSRTRDVTRSSATGSGTTPRMVCTTHPTSGGCACGFWAAANTMEHNNSTKILAPCATT
jgi:hypothetical protein